MLTRSSLSCFARLFVGRRSDYALQQDDGRYRRVGRPVTADALCRHLGGSETMGTYVMDEQGRCRFAVFDADGTEGLRLLADVQARLAHDGITSYLELSRRGGHLWVLLASLVPASVLRSFLLPYCPADMEFYPKQDEGTSGRYGSLIRLPLGVHRLAGRRYPFVSWVEGRPVLVARSASATLAWFATMERTMVPAAITTVADTHMPASVQPAREQHAHPSLAKTPPAETSTFTEATIRAWCASQDPFRVIGHYVKLDRRGLGCCPFGEHHSDRKDSHPSFRVYLPRTPSSSCWYCYVWQKGGTLFDFLCSYLDVDARTLWHRILAGETF